MRSDPIDLHRAGDVLEALHRRGCRRRNRQPAADLIVDDARYADPARLGDPLQPGRDIHPVAVDVVALDDDVAEVDADPEYDPLVFRDRDVALGHPALHRDRAGDGLDDAREFDQDAVAGRLDDAALVLGDLGIDQFAPQRLVEPFQRATSSAPISRCTPRHRRRGWP